MIIGAHIMVQSMNDAADMAFLTNVLKLSSVDVGDGFLLFGVPPAEVAVHKGDKNSVHELYLMCDDIGNFTAEMDASGIAYTPPQNQGWGTVTQVTLPGGGKLGVYQPHHKRPKHVVPKPAKKKKKAVKAVAKKAAKKTAKKASKKVKPRRK